MFAPVRSPGVHSAARNAAWSVSRPGSVVQQWKIKLILSKSCGPALPAHVKNGLWCLMHRLNRGHPQGKAPLRGFGLNKGKKINLLSEIQTDLFGRVMLADPASFDSSGCWGQACAFGLFSASAAFVSSQGEDEAVTLKSCTRRKTDSIEKRFCFDVEAVDR